MSIEIYNITDKKYENILFTICEKDLKILERVLIVFNNKTGVFIDPYGTTRLCSDHLQLLLELILEDDNLQSISRYKPQHFVKLFQDFLKVVTLKNESLILEGD